MFEDEEADAEEDTKSHVALAVPDPPAGLAEFALARYLYVTKCDVSFSLKPSCCSMSAEMFSYAFSQTELRVPSSIRVDCHVSLHTILPETPVLPLRSQPVECALSYLST